MKRTTLIVIVACGLIAGCVEYLMSQTADTRAGTQPAQLTDEQWKKKLTAEQYRVLRQAATEAPYTGKYDQFFEKGTYNCAACGAELFASDTKFDSGCGWPAFYAAKAGDRVKLVTDLSAGMVRTEVRCAQCGSHLGHIFDDAPQTPTGQRYCINSLALKFVTAAATAPATRPATAPAKKQ